MMAGPRGSSPPSPDTTASHAMSQRYQLHCNAMKRHRQFTTKNTIINHRTMIISAVSFDTAKTTIEPRSRLAPHRDPKVPLSHCFVHYMTNHHHITHKASSPCIISFLAHFGNDVIQTHV